MAKLKKRADGRYKATFMFNGKQYAVYSTNPKDLLRKKIAKIQELESGALNHDNPVLDDYYDDYEKASQSELKGATIRNQRVWYNACASVKICNGTTLGKMRIRDIKPKDCQLVQQALIDSGKASRTINTYMHHLSHVFNCAVRDETIEKNPCQCIRTIRRTEPTAASTNHRGLSDSEIKEFLEGAANSFYLQHFRMMLQTGIRVGELGALQESDIDKKENCVHITRTVTRTDIGAYEIGDSTKTYAGTRDIPLTPEILQTVNAQKELNRALFGLRFGSTLFPSSEGMLLREYTINREIKRITGRKNIDHFTCHAFRSTFATRWMEQRPQDFKILSEILGHSNTKITLDLYTHVMKESKEAAMKDIKVI